MLIISKSSKLEWDCKNNNVSQKRMLDVYKEEGVDTTAILNSHDEQLYNRDAVINTLSSADFCMMHEIEYKNISHYSSIISLSGDNGFAYICKHLKDHQSIAAINSSPFYSSGILTRWNQNNIRNIIHGRYKIEKWTRLKSNLLPNAPAISEYYLGETKRKDMSRHIIKYRDKTYKQKCSGLIIATGSGSTGWYNSINWHRTQEENRFNPTDKVAKFVVTEPFRSDNGKTLREGEILPGEKLVIHSLNDDGGLISADSWTEKNFKRGTKAIIELCNPLSIMVPGK